jgi:cell division cycle 14
MVYNCDDPYYHIHITDRIYIVITDDENYKGRNHSEYLYMNINEEFIYTGFCDDFGPMSLGTVFAFCQDINKNLQAHLDTSIVFITSSSSKLLTNAIFLLGAYMIMSLNFTLETVRKHLGHFLSNTSSYRDVSPGKQNFALTVDDCWGGLFRAKSLGWASFAAVGGFDPLRYDHYDNPLNADLHEIIPGKFIAMRGPIDLDGRSWEDVAAPDGTFSHRTFAPEYYRDILSHLGVKAVVRLNMPAYDRSAFAPAGIAVAELPFQDCTAPPPDIVARFLTLAEALPGVLAVHCKAGLGRTGTLIALYMMKHHGFTAREAMGWLRIVRPGSVIGPQQQFLCDKEAIMRRASQHARRRPASASGAPTRPAADTAAANTGGVEAMERLIADADRHVCEAMVRIATAQGVAAPATPSSQPPPPPPPPPPAQPGTLSGGGGGAAAARRLAAHVAAAADRRAGLRASLPATALTRTRSAHAERPGFE